MVRFVLDDAIAVGQSQLVVDYSTTGSTFVGEADDVRCDSLVPGNVAASFFNDVGAKQLVVDVTAAEQVDGPGYLAECRYLARDDVPDMNAFGVAFTEFPGRGQGAQAPAVWRNHLIFPTESKRC